MSSDPPPDPESSPAEAQRRLVVLLGIAVEGGMILLALFLGWLLEVPALATFHWDARDAGLGLLATLPMLVAFLIALRWPVGPFKKIKAVADEAIRPLLAPCTVLDLAGISMLAGLGEEMLFRGVLQGWCAEWWGNEWAALAAVSVLFGAAHAFTLAYAVFAAVMAVYLGWMWMVTENLLIVAIAHGLYDFVALIVLLRVLPEKTEEAQTTSRER